MRPARKTTALLIVLAILAVTAATAFAAPAADTSFKDFLAAAKKKQTSINTVDAAIIKNKSQIRALFVKINAGLPAVQDKAKRRELTAKVKTLRTNYDATVKTSETKIALLDKQYMKYRADKKYDAALAEMDKIIAARKSMETELQGIRDKAAALLSTVKAAGK